MADYDSDSSLDDAIDYTETGVLLGYAIKEPTEDTISHLGGHPVSRRHSRRTFRHFSNLDDTDMARSRNSTLRFLGSMQML